MEKTNRGNTLKNRIRSGQIRREDVTRRLAELAFGRANDCVRLALEDAPQLDKLDLSLLSEIKRNEKGTVEIRLIDRLKALEQLAQAAGQEGTDPEEFLKTMPCGYGQVGIDSFLGCYVDSLLTYGRSVGEIVVAGDRVVGLCWGDVTMLEVSEGDSPLDVVLWGPDSSGMMRPLPYPHLLLFTTLNPEAKHPYGVSLFRGMPFLADILMKIYNTIGTNWERAGNLRYSVVCKNGEDLDPAVVQERGRQVATEWAKAMEETQNGTVRDFVAMGDVEIKVIGGEAPVLDSQVPVRQMLEQLVAKTGLPPFLLGLNWSTTERMSTQQADILTSEIWALRRSVQPALEKICRTFLAYEGLDDRVQIHWNDISLQDITQEAQAELYKAQAEKARKS